MKISIVYTEDCVALTDFRALEPMMQRSIVHMYHIREKKLISPLPRGDAE